MTDDETAIRKLVADWMEATKAGDQEKVLGLMTDDVIFTVPGREPFGKEAFAQAAQAPERPKIDGTNEIVELRLLGDGWAYLRARIDMVMTPPEGAKVHRAGYTLTLLCKGEDGQWRITRDANLLTTKSQPPPTSSSP
ncbi:MAG: SgcJ/EcaC family oxidoreductase [Sphingobium sp.]|nr:SgcJ/EcaC family oxidoreductase [Sphingobium sp.]